MKTITLHKPVNMTSVYNHLHENLNPRFQLHKPTNFQFTLEKKGNTIDITQLELYEGILFHIEPDGDNLNITRNEHYTDDINNLALESTLNDLFDELSGNKGTDLVQEG